MKTINTALTFDQSNVAKFRLHCVELLVECGFAAFHQAFPQVGRRTVYRWKRKYLESDKRLTSLLPQSTRPHTVRQMRVPAEVLGFLKAMREKYPRLSKYKLKPFLDDFCQERGLTCYSVSWIGKVISRYQLFFNQRKPVVKRKRRRLSKTRIKFCPKQKDVSLGYLQLDGVEVVFEGRSYKFLTAVELVTRQAFVRRVTIFSSQLAKLFLNDIQAATNYTIHTVQTDNGSEFEGKFHQALDQINHLWSYPKKPKTQGYVERFNWTLQDEFVNYTIDQLTHDPVGFDQALKEWLTFYNTKRPHQGLDYQTPNQVLLQLQDKQNNGGANCAICV
jgi:hypothetical protein